APQFTRAELRIHPTAPIARGHLMVEGNSIDGQVSDDGKTLVAQLLLKDTTTYTIHLFTAGGHSDPQPRVNQVKVVTDAPPTVQLVEPARETTIAVGTKPNVVVRASDDYGLGQVRIESRDDAPTGDKSGLGVKTAASWTKFAVSGVVLDHPLELDPRAMKAGQTVWVRAVAQDRRQLELPELRLGPQESATPWQQIHIVATEAKAKVELAQHESLRTALARILQDQLRARAAAAGLPRSSTEAEAGTLAADIRGQQLAVQKAATAVTELIGATEDPERLTIKRVVGKLAFGEMVQALRQAEALQQVKLVAELARPSAKLMATQDRIIDVLRRLMNEIRKDTADLLAEMKKRPGTELPSDIQSKLKDLKDKLDEFLKQQKKVIEATESLAKKPVEDFTEKDKQLLKEMAATEDEWAKFMADKHTDLSKLPEQDFANPSLLKELVEVQTELKMAKDALTKKTADIAVPLEQLGAEMAKEMTTNIEKWLPDTPDREKWSQEEPLTDDMKEAPMAELPKEMEDIVGKLIEDEEDLFNEMEDASSSWADSLVKGAGWDAMDGPISNNSARGSDRQPPAQQQRDRRPQRRGTAGQVERGVRGRYGRGQGRAEHSQPPDSRRIRQGPGQGLQQGPRRRRHGRRQGERRGGRGAARACPQPSRARHGPPGDQAGPAPQQGRGGRSPLQGAQVPPQRPQADDRRHGRRRRRPQGWALPQRLAPPRRPDRGSGRGQDLSEGRGHRPPGPDRQSSHRHPEGDPGQHAGAVAAGLGRVEQAVLRAADHGPGSGGRAARDGDASTQSTPGREEVSDNAFRQDRPPGSRRVASTHHSHPRARVSRGNPHGSLYCAGRGLHCPLGSSRNCPAPGLRPPRRSSSRSISSPSLTMASTARPSANCSGRS